MNKYIKELLYEAGATYGGIHYLTGETILYTEDIDCQKFAQLIVKECLQIANRVQYSYDDADALQETIKLIKAHFGVE